MKNQSWSAHQDNIPLAQPAIDSPCSLPALQTAAKRIQECHRLLDKAGLNIVGELLRGQGTFYEMSHYPADDVYDTQTHSQYYYHNHRGLNNEHGHFHTFLRAPSIPDNIQPMQGFMRSAPWPLGADALAHFIGISMDGNGLAIGFFATNRWVTAQTWYSAEDTIALLDRFFIDHAYPNLVVNQWLNAMFVLFRPHIEALLRHRDKVIAAASLAAPEIDVLEDRALEITGSYTITLDQRIEQISGLS